jgi:DNA anti-recombination protein RmuC
MFTKRHEQELAEIKALAYELSQRFEQVVEQLGRIQEAQDQLAVQGQPATATGTRKAGSRQAEALDDGTLELRAGAKKARRRQAPAPDAVAAGGKSGKRRTKAGGAGKRRDPGARKRLPPAESALSSGSDEG